MVKKIKQQCQEQEHKGAKIQDKFNYPSFLKSKYAGIHPLSERIIELSYAEDMLVYEKSVEIISTSIKYVEASCDSFDKDTLRHSVAVTEWAIKIAKYLKLEKELENIILTGILHDDGKRNISRSLLNKPKASMDLKEWNEIQQHCITSAINASKLLKNYLERDECIHIINNIQFHHEKYDGSGYFHIKGEEIPLYSRIIAVPDVYDAITNPRPYRDWVLTKEEAVKHILKEEKLYDAKVLAAFLKILGYTPDAVADILKTFLKEEELRDAKVLAAFKKI